MRIWHPSLQTIRLSAGQDATHQDFEAVKKAAHAGSADAESHDDRHAALSAKDEEEDHEVERGIGAKGLVNGAEPTDERARSEENQPQQTQNKVYPVHV